MRSKLREAVENVEQHDLCIKCAREIFPKKNDDHGGVE